METTYTVVIGQGSLAHLLINNVVYSFIKEVFIIYWSIFLESKS